MPALLLIATWLLVAWGALAFGAVYPWAWKPLVTGAAVVGVAAWLVAWRHGARANDLGLLSSLAGVALLSLLQMVPLSGDLRRAFSPASESLLLEQDLEYALTAGSGGAQGALVSPAVPDRPLSVDPDATARAIVLLAGFTVLLGGLTRLLNLTGVRRLSTALVALGTVLALIGILQKAMLGDHAYGGMKIYGFWAPLNPLTTPFGPFVNRNHFAGWMLMGVPLALGLGLGWADRANRRRGKDWRAAIGWLSSSDVGKLQLAWLAALVMGVSLAMTQSRSGLAGLVLAAIMAAAIAHRRFATGRSRLAAIASLLVLVVVVIAWGGSDAIGRFADAGGSVGLRRQIWHDSVTALRDFFLTGTGLNTFSTTMLSYQSGMRKAHFQEAHNDYLQLLVEGGLMLAIPASLALVSLIAGIRRRFASDPGDGMTYWLRVGASTGLLAVSLQSLVEFSLQMPGNAVMCVALMAIALHEAPSRTRARRDTPPQPSP